MKTTITSMAIALMFAVVANADVIHEADYESEPTTGFGLGPSSMQFTSGGGDLIGFDANGNPETSGLALGVSDANANSGSFHYAVDTSQTVAGGGTANGWGASWSGQDSLGGSGGITDQATALANGPGSRYIDYSVGSMFTVTAQVATDAVDPLIGSGTAAVRLEFYYSIDDNGDGIEDRTSEIAARGRVQGNGFNAGSLTTAYQESTATYELTAADLDFASLDAGAGSVVLGFDRVVGVMGTDGNGHNPGTNGGMVYYDDYRFEVDSGSVVSVVPEPSSAVILAGLFGLCGLRRKKN